MQNDIVLSMRKICKAFPGVRALQNVDFTLYKGEIHALMGENGAGKSTLIKVLTGVFPKDSGQIHMAGINKEIYVRSPQEAQKLGISTVYQEITLCPNLTVAENMFIGRGNYLFVNWRSIEKKTTEILAKLNIPARANQQLSTCSLAVQQMVAIARSVDMDCKVLILDEPTSSLDENEVAKLFSLMRELKSRGVGIIFITHFLEQAYEICDRITVLRNGEFVGEYEIKDLPRVQLISKMLGKELDDISALHNRRELQAGSDATPVYEAFGLSSTESAKGFDFKIYKGEVNGFTGLLGSGRSESVRAIFGADKIILALQVMNGFFRPFSKNEAEAFADKYIKLLGIKTASIDTPIRQLSGGNQQKAILARWLLTNPKYLILDEPTRGIDVGTKVEIQKLVLKLAEDGVSVTFISSEIEEMLRTCSRLIVMRDRKIVGELRDEDMTQAKIMHTIAGEAAQNG